MRHLVLGWRSSLLVLTLLSFSIGGCHFSCGGPSSKELEKTLKKQLSKKIDKKVTAVKCPDNLSPKEGTFTNCQAKLEGGETLPIKIEWTDNKGGFSWETKPRTADLIEKLGGLISDGLARKYEAEFTGAECPEVAPKKGTTFECVATIKGGSKLPVSVTWTDDAGGYEYRDKGVVDLGKVERLLNQSLQANQKSGKVDCHGKIRASEPGSSFACTVTLDSGESEEVPITVDDWSGNIHLGAADATPPAEPEATPPAKP